MTSSPLAGEDRGGGLDFLHFFILVGCVCLYFPEISCAEPWIANRVSQNCAACHSPARRNVPMFQRRCTLSCQACHVNPSGGGIRTFYGQWQRERWLRSFISEFLGNKKTPAPLSDQAYANQPAGGTGNAPAGGHPLVTTDNLTVDESLYDRSDRQEKLTVQNDEEFMERATREDPLRKERRRWISWGGDIRYLYFDFSKGAPFTKNTIDYISVVDLGVRIKPIHRHFSLVFENRFIELDPVHDRVARLFNSGDGSVVRSAYALIDDLPFNSYLMGGLYFPLFGHYTPDRSSLAQSLSGFTLRSAYKAVSVGTAPNVPFFNFHLIGPQEGDGRDPARGFAYNAGGRFVTFGAYLMFSEWRTKGAISQRRKDLYSWTGGMSHKRLTANFELLKIRRQLTTGFSKSRVYTLETKTRLWRQNYFVLNFAQSNTSVTSAPGDAREYSTGFKSYLFPGLQLETLVSDLTSHTAGIGKTEEKRFQTQVHFFY